MLKGKRIGFIGGGAMAEAIMRGILAVGLVDAAAVYVTDSNEKRLVYLRETLGVSTYQSNAELAQKTDIVFLAVKPQVVDTALCDAASSLRSSQLLVSIAAGVATRTLENYFSEKVPVVRVMPNTPVLVREGATAVAAGRYATREHAELVTEIFGAVGRTVAIQEELMDAVTGLSGSGPAYVCLMIEALADGGVRAGLSRGTALTLAAQTLLGTAKLLLETGQHPGLLKDMVTSPGGTTIAGVHALEEGGLRAALINSVAAATERSRELGKQK
ncbi:MAG: pyrroline-5-carboxylate reductase [Bacillota bacterium]